MRVLIAGGGTGGHIYPGITVARLLAERGEEVAFMGTPHGLEAEVVKRYGFPFLPISSATMPRRISPAMIKTGFTALAGVMAALRHLREYRPAVVVGMGGYVSGPALLAARLLGIPTVIHEQNAYPGLTNRLLARLVSRVALGYEEAARHLPTKNIVFTGNPIRPEIISMSRAEGLAAFGLRPACRCVLVAPGSQGSRRINQAMLEALPQLSRRTDLEVIHAAGKGNFAEHTARLVAAGGKMATGEHGPCCRYKNILVLPYIHNMPAAYAAADLVVARGGAISAAEITARGIPAILIPYPYAAENPQLANHGAAVVLLDEEVNGKSLCDQIFSLLDAPNRLQQMQAASRRLGRPEAAAALVDLIWQLGRKRAAGQDE